MISKWAPYRWRYFWKNLPYIFWYEPKYFLQRTFRGWSADQLWSLDHSLGNIIVKYLRLFKASWRQGYPSNLSGPEEYEKILDDMIWGIDYLSNYDDKESELFDKMGVRFVKDPDAKPYTWSFKHEGPYEEWRKICDANLIEAKEKAKLFIEHFNSLWD